MNQETTIPKHLVRRFRELGAEKAFGIVGDFALRLFSELEKDDFPILVGADEQGSVFAADAFARLRGFGVVAVTYGVGGLKVVNATAGAWAEHVPLLVVSGAPGMSERRGDPLLHHKVKSFDTQLHVFHDVTVDQAVLANPLTAAADIDRVISAMIASQRPGYIEVPRDMIDVPILADSTPLKPSLPHVDEEKMSAAVAEVLDLLSEGNETVAVAGVMCLRRGLQDTLRDFTEIFQMPLASSSLAKGIISERHPLSVGVYMGKVSPDDVVRKVENADHLISFGVLNTDLTTGGFTSHLNRRRLIECTDTDVHIGLRTYTNVPLWAFLPALTAAARGRHIAPVKTPPRRPTFEATPGKPLTVSAIVQSIAAAIDERHGLIVEPGDCLFASVELPAPSWALASAYYATLGYAVPAALGAGVADPLRRPVVFVGDGAFLMTGLEALSAAFHGVHPIIIVLDNDGYGTQRPMMDGAFNNIPRLKSEELPRAFGVGKGFLCNTETELVNALAEAVDTSSLCIIRACVPRGHLSAALTRLTDALAKRV